MANTHSLAATGFLSIPSPLLYIILTLTQPPKFPSSQACMEWKTYLWHNDSTYQYWLTFKLYLNASAIFLSQTSLTPLMNKAEYLWQASAKSPSSQAFLWTGWICRNMPSIATPTCSSPWQERGWEAQSWCSSCSPWPSPAALHWDRMMCSQGHSPEYEGETIANVTWTELLTFLK